MLMMYFSAGREGVNVPFERRRSRRSLRKITPPPKVATVLSTPEGLPWIHFSPRYAQSFIFLRTSALEEVGVGMYFARRSKAAARQTEIEALEPRPEPIGIVDLRRKEMFW